MLQSFVFEYISSGQSQEVAEGICAQVYKYISLTDVQKLLKW